MFTRSRKSLAAVTAALAIGFTSAVAPVAQAQSVQGNTTDLCSVNYSAQGVLNSDLETGVGSLTGFTVNSTPNEYGDAAAQVQHWDPKTGTSYWRIPFGTAEELQNVRMEVDLPEQYELKAEANGQGIYDEGVVVYLGEGKFEDYGIKDERDNGGYTSGADSTFPSPESEMFRKKWNIDSRDSETLRFSIDEMPGQSHAVIQLELVVRDGIEPEAVNPLSQVDVRITADRACGIAGAAFNDANADGVWDAAELPMSGLDVILRNSAGEEVSTTVTDQDGLYRFGELAQDTYTVTFVAPDDTWAFTTGIDSDVNSDGIAGPYSFDGTTPQYGVNREFDDVNAGLTTDSPAGGGSSTNDRCIPTLLAAGIPLAFLIPIGLGAQVNIPGLDSLTQQVQNAIRDTNTQLQQGIGAFDPETAIQVEQFNRQFGPQLADAARGAGLVAAGLLALGFIADACQPGGGASSGSSLSSFGSSEEAPADDGEEAPADDVEGGTENVSDDVTEGNEDNAPQS